MNLGSTSPVDLGIGIVFLLTVGITLPAGLELAVGIVVALTALYLLPAIVGSARKKRNAMAIFILNVFLGWSVIGWVIALVWAVSVDREPPS